ncbi:MAG: tetratricopeptide repeat protein [Candidatus Obscuribacter sp.]|nr:tetratricopeptide repeat protein [Candidatus Obscuribacter sp.]
MRAQVLINTKQISKGLADYDYLIKTAVQGDTETYHFERARACERAGLYKEAIADYAQILQREKDQDEALYKRAICRSKLGQMNLALKDINDAIKYSGDNSRYLDTRAQIYDKLNKSSLAQTR